MQTQYSFRYGHQIQNMLFEELHRLSDGTPLFGRICAFNYALADCIVDSMKYVAATVEQVVMTILNVAGALFDSRYTVRDGVKSLENAAMVGSGAVISVATLAIKLPYQVGRILWDPEHAKSWSCR